MKKTVIDPGKRKKFIDAMRRAGGANGVAEANRILAEIERTGRLPRVKRSRKGTFKEPVYGAPLGIAVAAGGVVCASICAPALLTPPAPNLPLYGVCLAKCLMLLGGA